MNSPNSNGKPLPPLKQTRRRRLIIVLATLAAFLGALIPVGLSLIISWRAALQGEEQILLRFAEEAVRRSERVLAETGSTLEKLTQAGQNACSDEHIRLMRELSFSTSYIRELGYIRDDKIICTSWGRLAEPIAELAPDFVTADGTKVWFRAPTLFSQGVGMLIIRYENHNAVIDPVHLVDVLTTSKQRSLAVLAGRDLHLVGSLNNPPLTEMREFLNGTRDSNDHIYARFRSDTLPLVAVSSAPRSEVDAVWISRALIALPVGIVFGIVSVALIVSLARQRLSFAAEIRHALHYREFQAHYQPLISLADGRCIGAESLIRWRRSSGEMIAPDLFVPVAEASGSIHALTDYMIAEVVRELRVLLEARPDLHIAINLTADDLLSDRIEKTLARALQGTRIARKQIWLEATERSFISADAAKTTIARLRELGHKIAIDDFGTGYSSLSYLQKLHIDAIKIDKSFVDVIGAEAAASGVTPHIIDMAKSLNLEIIAEGVETPGQRDYLARRSVEYGQGWLFSKALTGKDFIAFVAQPDSSGGSSRPA